MVQMGRPKIDNPKSTQITARLDKETLQKLSDCMEFYHKTKAEVIRMGIEELFKAIKK